MVDDSVFVLRVNPSSEFITNEMINAKLKHLKFVALHALHYSAHYSLSQKIRFQSQYNKFKFLKIKQYGPHIGLDSFDRRR